MHFTRHGVQKIMLRMRRKLSMPALLIACAFITIQARGDALREANQLLEVSNTAMHFQSVAEQQTRAILRTYTGIVSLTTDIALPSSLLQSIRHCYQSVYDWKNFEQGIAGILTEMLSLEQIRLLTDFYQSRGLSPTDIETFKQTVAMAEQINLAAQQYIYANSGSCVERDARLILGFLGDHPDIRPLAVPVLD